MKLAVPKRGRPLLVAATLALAVLLALTLLQGADAAHRHGPNQTQMILRLSDLPLGYMKINLEEGEDEKIYCSPLTHSEDTPPKVVMFVDRFHPKGCLAAYYRLYDQPGQKPGGELVGTGVLALPSDKAADAAWAVAPELLGPPPEVKATERIGKATKLFHYKTIPFLKRLGRKSSLLVWRSGNTLAVIMATGPTFAESDRAAAELARLQDAHIRKPTRYTSAERFDGEVPLDNPAIEIPVYWLGRNFNPGGDLPENRLFDSGFTGKAGKESTDPFEEGPAPPLYIRYDSIRLDTWTPSTWNVFAKSKTGRAITGWKCTKTRTVPLAEGTATIFAGYRRDFERCPKKAPEAFTAWVDVGGVKVVVNPPFAADSIEGANPYGSFEGMEAIARSLVLRPKRIP